MGSSAAFVQMRLAARRGRYGKSLVKHALDVAWEHQCYKVMLQTGSKRESTHGFYKSCGFKPDEKFAFVAQPSPVDEHNVAS